MSVIDNVQTAAQLALRLIQTALEVGDTQMVVGTDQSVSVEISTGEGEHVDTRI